MSNHDIARKAAEEIHSVQWHAMTHAEMLESATSIILRAIESARSTDTERLDWLGGDGDESFFERREMVMDAWYEGAKTLRAAIDAAMKQSKDQP